MPQIPAVAFVGRQNSGKTTLLEALIAELVSRGIKVGTVKHHSHAGFAIDYEGKDSWRHRKAGSSFVVVASPDQIASVRSLEHEIELDEILPSICDVDVILVEGYRQSGLPTIELFRSGNPNDQERELGGLGNRIIAVVTDIPRIELAAAKQALPVFSFKATEALATFIETAILNWAP
ncbi:MAG: molybdopterin-guanine dinucleotide biosynthesis protein B [Coriobacteriales bacterium]|jgi:molybdopterin-guanine dinucleotide biosynthesis protein MobB|nr:molybdopterin-guanine dinucleotide biosynthesis protein B [Coriobacteriales bacterium]